MNEIIFITHIFVVISFVIAALRFGSSHSLISLVAVQAILANLFVVKQMNLFGMTVTCSDVYSIGCILSLNLLQEYYGKDLAKKAIQISFLGLIFFMLMSQIHLWYLPAPSDITHTSFQTIFAATPRIIFASIAVFYLVMKLDLTFFAWLKQKLAGKFLPQRVGLSLFFSQFVDTVLFSFMGLYGIVESVLDIILISYFVKCIMIVCSTPLVAFSKRLVKEDAV
jgi:uncharacterized integral membrane protein (TIGR00697 family)